MSSNPEPPEPALDDGDVIVYAGDCIEVMRQMPEASVDAIVTDPPYGLEFMGKDWDAPWRDGRAYIGRGGDIRGRTAPVLPQSYVAGTLFQEWTELWAREAFRILKPGGHLLAFAGTRTYHRMASGVEDAGFEIRDCIAWMYGSGFPKSLDVSKAIDKAAGAERHIEANAKIEPFGSTIRCATCGKSLGSQAANCRCDTKGVPVTPDAEKWSGWGTALKPAFEPVVVARKPLVGTVAQNVLEHGTGAINVDGCRIGTDVISANGGGCNAAGRTYGNGMGIPAIERGSNPHVGRWPANVVLDETAGAMLDEQSGNRPSRGGAAFDNGNNIYGHRIGYSDRREIGLGDNGGASRFFYTAKASRQDRNTGGLADNTHPTVKPTELMRWLIRLVTPPGGTILDPFGGSGSTGVAARAENVRCILIEREAEYLSIIRDRLAQQSLFAEEHREK